MKTKNRWKQTIQAVELCLVIGGILLYSQLCGLSHPWHFAGFLAGMAGLMFWLKLTRARVRRQLAVLLLLSAYALFVPAFVSHALSGTVFVAGLMLPATIVAAALYFGAFRRRKRMIGD